MHRKSLRRYKPASASTVDTLAFRADRSGETPGFLKGGPSGSNMTQVFILACQREQAGIGSSRP